jgi:hypothetical protein
MPVDIMSLKELDEAEDKMNVAKAAMRAAEYTVSRVGCAAVRKRLFPRQVMYQSSVHGLMKPYNEVGRARNELARVEARFNSVETSIAGGVRY